MEHGRMVENLEHVALAALFRRRQDSRIQRQLIYDLILLARLCVPQPPERLDILPRILIDIRRRLCKGDMLAMQLGNLPRQ